MRLVRSVSLESKGELHSDIKGDVSSNPEAHRLENREKDRKLYDEWKETRQRMRYRNEQLQIEGKVDVRAQTASASSRVKNVSAFDFPIGKDSQTAFESLYGKNGSTSFNMEESTSFIANSMI